MIGRLFRALRDLKREDAAAQPRPGPMEAAFERRSRARLDHVRRLAEAGQTVAAIQAYRDATGASLRDAYLEVQAMVASTSAAAPGDGSSEAESEVPPAAEGGRGD